MLTIILIMLPTIAALVGTGVYLTIEENNAHVEYAKAEIRTRQIIEETNTKVERSHSHD